MEIISNKFVIQLGFGGPNRDWLPSLSCQNTQ